MSKKELDISRRKVLAGLGTAGVAAAGAGLGTTAYLSDTESFEDNVISAGTLDLKVDWEEHYSYPQIYGFDDPTMDLDVRRTEPPEGNYVALPDPENPMVWVASDDLDAYMDNTAIEAYPDVDGNRIQDPFQDGDVQDACTDGADVPADLDPTQSFRTQNADTYDDEAEEYRPLVSLDDVKPGDFGELTLSFHLCSNPGYVWLRGQPVRVAENGHTEPEADADAEEGSANESKSINQGASVDTLLDSNVELLDAVETALWYDGDCDNVFDTDGEQTSGEVADVVIVMDRSGSMSSDDLDETENGAKTLIDALGPNDQVGLVSFSSDGSSGPNDSSLDSGLTTSHTTVRNTVDNLPEGGQTNMEAAVERAHEELLATDTFSEYGESGNARSNARKIMVFLGDGGENRGTDVTDGNDSPTQEASNAKDAGIEIYTIAYGNPGSTAESTLQNMASDPQSDYYFEADISTVEDVFEDIGGTVSTGGEELIFRGTLRETLAQLSDDDGVVLDADLESDGIQCYPALQTNCVGLAWWVPTDVGNQIQGDTVEFDLGFYAEQCRNNDGPQIPQ